MNTSAFNITGKRKVWYALSILLILPGIVSLFVWHLNVGIDFKGGTMQQITFANTRPAIDQLRSEVDKLSLRGSTVQETGDKGVIIRFANQDGLDPHTTANNISAAFGKLSPLNTDPKLNSFQNIGGSVAQDTTRNAITAVLLTCVAIILFIAFSFRSVPKPANSWRFAVTTILALAHDLLFVVGAYSIIGHFFPSIEVDSLFITALLTILGFSVNDTIVVFDRIRENLRRTKQNVDFEEITNASLNQTLARSINTSMTVLIVLVALLLLGGESIRNFILALTLGVAIGTYSSIFNASPLLVTWQKWADSRAPQQAKRR